MDEVERVVQQIYEAADDPEYWEVVAPLIADLVGGGPVHLFLASSESGIEYLSLFARGDPGFAAEYLSNFAGQDFRVPRVLARPPGVLLDERSYVSREEARRSVIHQELLPKHGVHNIVGSNMSLEDSIGWFGVSTRHACETFDEAQRDLLARVAPHILGACRILKRRMDLERARALAVDALDLVSSAILLLHRGRLVQANAAAERLLRTGFFRLGSGRLECRDRFQDGRIAACLKEAAGGLDSVLAVRDYESGIDYLVRCHAAGARGGAGRANGGAAAVVSITEVDDPAASKREDVAAFCASYGVSAAEVSVVHAALSSTSLRTLAHDRGVALDTVRKQLKTAMARMGLDSQKKLFRAFERYRLLGRG